MINLVSKKKCTGCSACSSICPKNSIEMKRDNEGFLYPTVSENCIECGLCMDNCPFGVDIIGKMKEAAKLFGK